MRARFIPPQLCTLAASPPTGRGWLHETKFDGYRVQMRVEHDIAELRTRNGLDWSRRWPEIAREGAVLEPCIVDGEVCAVDADGHSDFGRLQDALSTGDTVDLVYFVFDCLAVGKDDLRPLPLVERKRHLQALLRGRRLRHIRFVKHVVSGGKDVLENACRAGLEGLVSKRADAPYQSGRSVSWIKAKCRGNQEVVIGGWSGTVVHLRSLAVGAWRDGKLAYMGRVGTGFSAVRRNDLLARLRKLERARPPFDPPPPRERGLHWVRPVLVAEVEFENVTTAGLLRQAAFKGLRMDRPARSVVPEVPEGSVENRVGLSGCR